MTTAREESRRERRDRLLLPLGLVWVIFGMVGVIIFLATGYGPIVVEALLIVIGVPMVIMGGRRERRLGSSPPRHTS